MRCPGPGVPQPIRPHAILAGGGFARKASVAWEEAHLAFGSCRIGVLKHYSNTNGKREMLLKVILNQVERHPRFVYTTICWGDASKSSLHVKVTERKRSKGECSGCGRRGPTHDHLPERRYQFVPLWNLAVFFLYRARRIACPHCGVRVERLPWAKGKEHTTHSFQWFLARWAKRLSWSETASAFGVKWDTVYRSVKMAVCWGLRHRDLSGIKAIGIDEVCCRKKNADNKYLTLVYQIDQGCRRLLWIGPKRKRRTLRRFFRLFGEKRTEALSYICSDMWSAFLSEVAASAPEALHILDRFHIVQLFNKAINKVRADEARQLKAKGDNILKNKRWLLLRRRDKLNRSDVIKLNDLVKNNLKTTKCYLMKEDFQRIWDYKQPWRIAYFFVDWVNRAKRSRIKPMVTLARTLDSHAEQIFNWFEAKGEISQGAVEGMNSKVKLTTRRSYGYRGKNTIKYALYHNLGKLPEPPIAHRFC